MTAPANTAIPAEYRASREFLRIKYLTMIQEARIIRRKERSLHKWKKHLKQQNAKSWQDMTDAEKAAIKGQRMYEYKENRKYNPELRSALFEHRVQKNRPIIRAMHLARGYLRKVPYRKMETMAYVTPNWAGIWAHITKFGGVENTKANQQAFMDWADEAATNLSPKHNIQLDYTTHLTEPKPSVLIKAALSKPKDG